MAGQNNFSQSGDSLNNFFQNNLDMNKFAGLPIEAKIRMTNNGIKRTDGGSLQTIRPPAQDASQNVVSGGFTPLWYYKGEDVSMQLETDPSTFKTISSTRDKFVVTRNIYVDAFKDSRQDNFRHDLSNLVPIANTKSDRHAFDGKETSPLRLSLYKGSSYENNDPIAYGYEVVINVESSPLLNGSIEDFIDMFRSLSEISSRGPILTEFKQQFYKFFKTNTPISVVTSTQTRFSQIGSGSSTNTEYLSYYLKKISGLENLVESNTSEKNKSFIEYRKDKITLSFTEDVSMSVGTLASLYKSLYWSRLNGKNLIPENLLRFDCFIIVSEIRNYERVRKAVNSTNPSMALEMLADNLSRYVYNLYECQFYFDKMSHPNELNLGEDPKIMGDSYDVTFDYKYSTMKFEKWIADDKLFGKYATLNNDRIDPMYVGPSETKNATITFGTSSAGSYSSISFEEDTKTPIVIDSFDPGSFYNPINSTQSSTSSGGAKGSTYLERLKKSTLKNVTNLAKRVEHNLLVEAQSQINKRFALLNDSLDKIRNASGIGKMSQPTNVYEGYYDKVSQTSGLSTRFFYDIHNSLRDFGGDQLGSITGGG